MACPQQGLPGSEQGTVVDLQEKSLSTGEHPGEPQLMQSTAEPQERAVGRVIAMHSHCYLQLPTQLDAANVDGLDQPVLLLLSCLSHPLMLPPNSRRPLGSQPPSPSQCLARLAAGCTT